MPFHITKVECDVPGLKVQQKVVKDGEQYVLTISYAGGWSAGTVERKIVVFTDDPQQPRIEIRANVVAATGGKP